MAAKNKTVVKTDGNKMGKFFREVKAELKKVTWPTRKTLITQTIVVITTVLILGVFLGIADGFFSLLYATIK